MIDVPGQLRALWEHYEIASSRTPALRKFVEEILPLVQHCKRICGKCDLGTIEFSFGGDPSASLQFIIPNAKGQFRSIIANLAAIVSEKHALILNPYGDTAVLSLQMGDENAQRMKISFSNTIREPNFCIELSD